MARLGSSRWVDCTIEDGRFGVSKGEGISMVRCELPGAEMDRARWPHATFTEVNFRGASMPSMKLPDAVFVDCDLREVDLTDAVLEGARFERCDLRGAKLPDLDGAILLECQRDP
jgi:uncharacterized protein YjbI with pentapeptide repeats